MKIIIISAFDPLPWDDAQLIRYGYLAATLVERGHTVSYISSSFFHLNKCQREFPVKLVKPFSEIKWHLISTSSYKKNVSLGRILNHVQFAFRLKKLLKKLISAEKPDLIVCAFPPVLSSYFIVKIGKKYNVPVVLDIQDLWPESMERFVKSQILKFPLRFHGALRNFSIKNANAICSVSSYYLNFLKKQIGNKKNSHFPIGINSGLFYSMYEQNWKKDFFHPDKKYFVYLGSSTHNRELQVLFNAMKKFPAYHLLLVGKGHKNQKDFNRSHKNLPPNVCVTGGLPFHDLVNLLFRSHAGFALADSESFTSFPSKIFYYMSANLPYITNIQNEEFLEFAKNEEAVKYYPSGKISKLAERIEELEMLDRKDSLYHGENFSAEKVYNEYAGWLEGI